MSTGRPNDRAVNKLQEILEAEVFHYAKDKRKAAGRALGTLVEVIAYYLLKTWGLNDSISIERGLAEYGNPEILHNVEYSLHPIVCCSSLEFTKTKNSITGTAIWKALCDSGYNLKDFGRKNQLLLSGDRILRNACTIAESSSSFLLCSITEVHDNVYSLNIYEQHHKPFAIFECKRVGVEEGMTKGPQTIEKAKQGAYVARTTSSLQKLRTESGQMHGIIYKSNGDYILKPYDELMEEVVSSEDVELLRRFILTVGIVSNHGNWFTNYNQNKELKVLAQSYDWLLFLTDAGLGQFVEDLLLRPSPKYEPICSAFKSSYGGGKTKNQFTKVQMNIDSDRLLLDYFQENIAEIERWFNVISPAAKTVCVLKSELKSLMDKDWRRVLT